jgi:hypothetical protein
MKHLLCVKIGRLIVLTADCGWVNVEVGLLQPRGDADEVFDKGRHRAPHDHRVAHNATWILHLRLVMLVDHCNT